MGLRKPMKDNSHTFKVSDTHLFESTGQRNFSNPNPSPNATIRPKIKGDFRLKFDLVSVGGGISYAQVVINGNPYGDLKSVSSSRDDVTSVQIIMDVPMKPDDVIQIRCHFSQHFVGGTAYGILSGVQIGILNDFIPLSF